MATTHFASLPNVSLPRTKMGVNFTHPMSFKHGEVIPVFHAFVQPGDSFKLDLSMLLRMSTPIFPIMGDIDLYAHSFFVPMRLIYDKTPEFFGENTASAGPQTTEYLIPQAKPVIIRSNAFVEGVVVGSVSHHLGNPALFKDSDFSLPIYSATKSHYDNIPAVSVLPERGYWTIINEYYRAQQVQAPIHVDTSTLPGIFVTDNVASGDTIITTPSWSKMPWITNKKLDYYTSATIAPQYSADPVTLPLGDYAPLGIIGTGDYQPDLLNGSDDYDTLRPFYSDADILTEDDYGASLAVDNGGQLNANADDVVDISNSHTYFAYKKGATITPGHDDYIWKTNLVADLSSAVAANVNQIRLAFATQRFLERDLFGTRYPEIIKSHFGVTSSLSILQRPQLLYKGSCAVNIQQVLSTADATTTTGTKLGQPGANSVTAFKCPIVHNSFDEFGFLYVLIETKYNRVYSQGFNRFRLKKTKFDFYFPEFATIGDQEVKAVELYGVPGLYNYESFKESDVFGYQEAWAEYRYFPDIVSGAVDPATHMGFGYMTLAEDFVGKKKADMLLSDAFLREDREALARCLTTGVSGPDYVGDFAITGTMIRTMPLYSIPGLVDHVGGR